jgi:hypothetical protein
MLNFLNYETLAVAAHEKHGTMLSYLKYLFKYIKLKVMFELYLKIKTNHNKIYNSFYF